MLKSTLIKKLLLKGKSVDAIADEINTTKLYVSQVKRESNIINGTEQLVEHHIKYKEIHGIDETIWITMSEHKKLHHRLRKEGKCNVSSEKLHSISISANHRTIKYNERQKKYRQSDQGQKIRQIYHNGIKRKIFTESPGVNIQFRMEIYYNHATDNISYSTLFRGQNGHKLPIIDI